MNHRKSYAAFGATLAMLCILSALGCGYSSSGSASGGLVLGSRSTSGLVTSVAVSRDGQWLVAGSMSARSGADNAVHLWDLSRPEVSSIDFSGHTDAVRSVAINPSATSIASGSDDKTIRIWELNQPHADPVVLKTSSIVNAVAFSPDGQRLAAGLDDGAVRIWNTQAPYIELVSLNGHDGSVNALAFSPDNQLLASGSQDRTLRVWDLRDYSNIRVLGNGGGVTSVAFSPDSRLLASASFDSKVRMWQVDEPAKTPRVLKPHQNAIPSSEVASSINSIAFSPDGQMLTAGSLDTLVYLWDLTEQDPNETIFRGHRLSVTSVAFLPNGQTVVSGSHDGTVRLWNTNQASAAPTAFALSK